MLYKKCTTNTLTSNQRWNKVDRQHLSTLFQRWYLVKNQSWADLYLLTLFQHWNVVAFSTLKHGYHNFTSIVSYHQNWFWFQSKFNLFQRWECNVDSTLISCGQKCFLGVLIFHRKTPVPQFLQLIRACSFTKRRFRHRCLLVNFAKFALNFVYRSAPEDYYCLASLCDASRMRGLYNIF